MRVIFVNMSEPGATCPQGLTQKVLSGLTLCGSIRNQGGRGCQSTIFSTLGLNYSQVCGQLRGYQFNSPDAFLRFTSNPDTIDSPYVDGVSITYGRNPRKHIWTYAGGLYETNDLQFNYNYNCPCNNGSTNPSAVPPPAFVGNDYFCESAGVPPCCQGTFFNNDPLWDGQQCHHAEGSCCIDHPNLPWFNTKLNANTTDDIELRVCGDQGTADEDTPLQVIELLVQ